MPNRKKKKPIQISTILVFIFLTIGFLLVLYPLLWMFFSSFKNTQELYETMWQLPKIWRFENYVDAWEKGISKYLLNSVVVTGATIFLALFISSLCAYGLSRYKYKFLSIFFFLCMGGMMISPQVCLVPLYVLLENLKIRNTLFALILPYVAFRSPLIMLLTRSYFLSIPKEIEESAAIEGCSSFQIYSKIFLPMSKPILLTGVILVAYYAWNEFLFATIFIDSAAKRTLASGLMNFRDALQVDWGPILAGMVLSVLPIAILFIFMQKHFIRGMTSGAIKG